MRSFIKLILIITPFFLVSCEYTSAEGKPVDPRDKLVGFSNQFIGDVPYQVKVTKDFLTENGLILNGFDDITDDVRATLVGSRLVIPKQHINGEWIEGEGVIDDTCSKIRVIYSNDGIVFKSLIKL